MPSLKELRGRINSVKSTRKITSAMKMVAASKLRRAQAHAEAARPYAEAMQRMLAALARNAAGREGAPRLLAGTGKDQVHLVVPITSDRGLAGGFNAAIVRAADQSVNPRRCPRHMAGGELAQRALGPLRAPLQLRRACPSRGPFG